jgi:hypothetical protein
MNATAKAIQIVRCLWHLAECRHLVREAERRREAEREAERCNGDKGNGDAGQGEAVAGVVVLRGDRSRRVG